MATRPAKARPAAEVIGARDPTPRQRGGAWMRKCAAWLRKQPLCQDCAAEGVVNAYDLEVDHVVPLFKGGKDDESNYRTRCSRHHKLKTAQDMGHVIRSQIGVDGWPIE